MFGGSVFWVFLLVGCLLVSLWGFFLNFGIGVVQLAALQMSLCYLARYLNTVQCKPIFSAYWVPRAQGAVWLTVCGR